MTPLAPDMRPPKADIVHTSGGTLYCPSWYRGSIIGRKRDTRFAEVLRIRPGRRSPLAAYDSARVAFLEWDVSRFTLAPRPAQYDQEC